jgi:hypothetical protein
MHDLLTKYEWTLGITIDSFYSKWMYTYISIYLAINASKFGVIGIRKKANETVLSNDCAPLDASCHFS